MPRPASVLLLIAVVAAAAILVWQQQPLPAPPTPPSPAGTTSPLDSGPSPSQATPPTVVNPPDPVPQLPQGAVLLPLPTASTTPVAGHIEYPDHSWLPPLNGVREAPRVSFHRLTPFTKVTARIRDAAGREWYLHENGVRSTTYLDPNGKPTSLVTIDMPTAPQLPDESPPKTPR